MITFAFVTVAIINALMLIALLGVIFYKNAAENQQIIDKLEQWQDILVLGVLIGTVGAIALSAMIII